MSESGMVMDSRDREVRAMKQVSYTSRFDGGPDDMPELAREVIMLRGVVESLRQRVAECREVHEEFRHRLDAITHAKHPIAESSPIVRNAMMKASPEVSSPLGCDLRVVYTEACDTLDSLEALMERMRSHAHELAV